MKRTCPLCGKSFIFSAILFMLLNISEVFKRNPDVEIICSKCGNARIVILTRKP